MTKDDSSPAEDIGSTRSEYRPVLAAALSAIVPGLGQTLSRRYVRAALWFSPVLVAAVFVVRGLGLSTAEIVGAALDPTFLWGIFWLNIIGLVWRMGAAVDAYRLANASGRGTGAMAFAVGWALIAMLMMAPHVIIGRYALDAVTLVSVVFVDDDPDIGEPVIPIGTDADIVPDPVVAAHSVESWTS